MPINYQTTSYDRLEPAQFPDDVRRIASSKFAASLTLAKGTVVAKRTSDGVIIAYVEPNAVQTVTIAGTLSGGTFRITARKSDGTWQTTDAIAFNANAAAIQTALNAVLGTSAVAVAGTVASFTITFSGTGYAAIQQPLVTVNTGATTGATTSVVAETTTFTGAERAIGMLDVAVATDANSNIFLGDSAVASQINLPVPSAPIVVGGGAWDTSVLTGWDAGALADLGGRTLGNGLVRLP